MTARGIAGVPAAPIGASTAVPTPTGVQLATGLGSVIAPDFKAAPKRGKAAPQKTRSGAHVPLIGGRRWF